MGLKLGLRNKIRRSRAAGGFVGLLDQPFATGATAAYSLRLLRAKHSGGLVRVRADDSGTDKGEADVLGILQPDGSKIITLNSPIENLNSKAQTRLGAPAGGGDKVLADLVDAGGQNFDGFASNWYGQTPNTNDATQSNASQQPKIVDSGSVIQENGGPAMDFDGNDDYMQSLFSQIYSQPITIIDVFNLEQTNTYITRDGNSSNGQRIALTTGGGNFNMFASTSLDGATIDTNQHLFFCLYNTSNSEFYQDGSLENSGDVGSGNIGGLTIGALNDGSDFYANAKYQEIILYSNDQSSNRTKFEAKINNHYQIF